MHAGNYSARVCGLYGTRESSNPSRFIRPLFVLDRLADWLKSAMSGGTSRWPESEVALWSRNLYLLRRTSAYARRIPRRDRMTSRNHAKCNYTKMSNM